MKIEDLKKIIDLFTIVSKDSTRPQLQGVAFMEGQAFATDGFKAAWVDLDESRDDLFINVDNLPMLKAVYNKFKKINEFPFEEIKSLFIALPENFPRAKVIQAMLPVNAEATIAFNAKFLYDLLKSLKNSNKMDTVELTITGALKPIGVRLTNGNTGILMPHKMG